MLGFTTLKNLGLQGELNAMLTLPEKNKHCYLNDLPSADAYISEAGLSLKTSALLLAGYHIIFMSIIKTLGKLQTCQTNTERSIYTLACLHTNYIIISTLPSVEKKHWHRHNFIILHYVMTCTYHKIEKLLIGRNANIETILKKLSKRHSRVRVLAMIWSLYQAAGRKRNSVKQNTG